MIAPEGQWAGYCRIAPLGHRFSTSEVLVVTGECIQCLRQEGRLVHPNGAVQFDPGFMHHREGLGDVTRFEQRGGAGNGSEELAEEIPALLRPHAPVKINSLSDGHGLHHPSSDSNGVVENTYYAYIDTYNIILHY